MTTVKTSSFSTLSDYVGAMGSENGHKKRQELSSTVKNYLNLVGTPAKFITDDFLEMFSA